MRSKTTISFNTSILIRGTRKMHPRWKIITRENSLSTNIDYLSEGSVQSKQLVAKLRNFPRIISEWMRANIGTTSVFLSTTDARKHLMIFLKII